MVLRPEYGWEGGAWPSCFHRHNRKMRLPLCLALVLPLAAHAAELHPHPCVLHGESALCATLPVWENRATRTGRRIELNIAILPALAKDHAPDPLFLLHGGPGAAATDLARAFARHPIR